MSRTVLLATSIIAVTCFHLSTFAKNKKRDPSSVDRPPQFVLFAFDGSSNLDMWKETVAFAKTVPTKNVKDEDSFLKFTYFVNPVYYLEVPYKTTYKAPQVNRNLSCIGYATPDGSTMTRLELTNAAFLDGHEIGSHANSHCTASGTDRYKAFSQDWSETDWNQEFEQFNNLFFNVLSINHITPPKDYVMKYSQNDIKGFRAPALAFSEGLWPTLKKFGFKYDTSQVDSPTHWPLKADFSSKWNWGGWEIPLAQIKVAGTQKKTLSMDYNWFFFQTAGASLTTPEKCKNDRDFVNNVWCKQGIYITTEKQQQMKNQMLESYKYYFKNNYFGGRGPVQIGHHFSKWNGGAYWEGMQEFAKFVCSKPEVKCVTMSEYVGWLESLTPEQLSAYRHGQFETMPDDGSIKDIAAPVMADIRLDINNGIFEAMTEVHEKVMIQSLGLHKELSVNFKPVVGKTKITNAELEKIVGKGEFAYVRASLVSKRGAEVNWQTYRVTNVGLPDQKISERPLEEQALKPETAEAHNTPN